MNRSDESLFDPRIADWLEDDPFTAPDQALDVVLAAFPSIRQRRAVRVPWRASEMTPSLRLGLAAVAVVVAVGGGLLIFAPRSGSGPGDLGATPTPRLVPSDSPSVSPALVMTSIGSLTLSDTTCTFSPSVDPLGEGVLTIATTSEAATASGVDVFKVRSGYTFADLESHVVAENARIARREPYVGFPVAGVSITQVPLAPGEVTELSFTATAGTYGLVCVRGVSKTENPLAYYLVGPLEVAR